MEEKESFALDLSSLIGKFTENKKLLVYVILILILILSAYLRMLPASHGPYLSAMDPYWHYRHAKEILDHGYPGTELKSINGKMVPWDSLHDAPFGEAARKEFYPYFIAYSYKYFGQFVTSSLMSWDGYTPVIFGVLAVFLMFLLVKQLFGDSAGLAASFMYSLSAPFMMRSVAGFADTDAPIAFFTLLTFFLFIRAWDRKSFVYAGAAGLSLGFFGTTWPEGYSFAPFLIIAATFFYFIGKIAYSAYKKESVLKAIIEDWKKYTVLLIFLVIGLSMVAFIIGPGFANIMRSVTGFIHIKAIQRSTDTGNIRNVLLTVAEMNPPGAREIIARIHITILIFALIFPISLFFGLWKKLEKFKYHLLFFTLWLLSTLYSSITAGRFIEMLVVPLSVFVGLVIADLISRIDLKKPLSAITIAVFLLFTLFMLPNIPASAQSSTLGPPYFQTAVQIARQSGPSIGQNWLNLFEWMRTQTNKTDIMASWWDPGHAVTALGERPVVADGSQNYVHVHDLAVAFTTDNESLAVKMLKKYNVSYFFTSSDLIGKYGAISFLASGYGENYLTIPLSDVKQTGEGMLLIYSLGKGQSIIIDLKSNNISASFRQGYQSRPISKIYYFVNNTGYQVTEPGNNTINAMLYVLPDYKTVIFLPPKLENNMLTRLQLFDGAGLSHFKLVKNFGGQIKVYKVNY